jgi:hypothetical protein
MFRNRVFAGLAAACATLALSAAPASAYTVNGPWIVSDYVTGFPQPSDPNSAGPIGLAFDGSGNLLVTDINSGTFHRVPPGGGTASGTMVGAGLGKAAGLAFGADGRLYMARADMARVDEVNPANGSTIRTVASTLACPTALATDPLSGDLFASNKCGGAVINRIAHPATRRATVSTFTKARADGLTFAPDGTLFAAIDDAEVDSIAATNSSSPGTRTKVAAVDDIDGIVYAPARASHAAYLVVNRTNGEIDMLDFSGNLTPIVTGASRGDLVTVGPDNCIYAALQDRVIKLAPSRGSCDFAQPVTPTQPAGTPPSSTPAPTGGGGAPGGGSPDGQQVLGVRTGAPVVDLAASVKALKMVRKGSRFTITLKVMNRSSKAAHKVVLTAALPKRTKFVSARSVKGVRCKARARKLTCTKASLAARKAFAVKLVLSGKRGATYALSAKVTSSDLDPAPGNNSARAKTRLLGR